MFGNKKHDEGAPKPQTVTATNEPKYKLKNKIRNLDFEIARQEGSGNMQVLFEDGRVHAVKDIDTILLWEILKVLSK